MMIKQYKQRIKLAAMSAMVQLPLLASGNKTGGGGGGKKTLADAADSIKGGMTSFLELLLSGAYLAGFGIMIGAIFKFKQHRDNPTQVPVGTPFMMLMVSVALIFLPSFVTSSGAQVFGDDAKRVGADAAGSDLLDATP